MFLQVLQPFPSQIRQEKSNSNPQIQRLKLFKIKVRKNKIITKENVIKKIKLRFFRNYCRKYVIKFFECLNAEKSNLLQEKLEYRYLDRIFLNDISPSNHSKWKIKEKSILEIFNEFSPADLDNVVNSFLKDKKTFKDSLISLNENTKCILLEPFGDVYKRFLKNKKEFKIVSKKIKNDFSKKYQKGAEDFDFDDMIFSFTSYIFD